jgi:hypothetical protein
VEEFRRLTLGVMTGIEEIEKPLSLALHEWMERWRTPLRNRRVRTEPYIAALRQIGIMLDAGMPINTALEEAILYTDDAMLRYILQRMLSDIESGRSLSDAIRPFERQLGYLSLSMLELGEQTGTLADAVLKLADILEQIEDNRRQLIKATRYPVFIIFAMVVASSSSSPWWSPSSSSSSPRAGWSSPSLPGCCSGSSTPSSATVSGSSEVPSS